MKTILKKVGITIALVVMLFTTSMPFLVAEAAASQTKDSVEVIEGKKDDKKLTYQDFQKYVKTHKKQI